MLPENALKEKLETAEREKRPLRVKLGIDPSSPYIHLGFTIPLRKLRAFQDLGHKAVLIIGDFTGKIGDPTGKNKTRPQLTEDDINANMETYRDQVFKILDVEKTEIRYNGEWSDKMTPQDVVKLASKYTVARMLERDYFSERFKAGEPISIHEFLYPLFQAYDSVAVKADIEIGGTDQTFNFLLGRIIQEEYGCAPQMLMTMPLLEGIDGVRKMSKSYGNHIGITDSPKEMFGKTMSIPDNLIVKYFTLATDMDMDEIKKIESEIAGGGNPRNAKVALAKKIIEMYHSKADADNAEDEFNRIFKDKGLPDEIAEVKLDCSADYKMVSLLTETGLTKSNSDARRILQQGGVKLNQQTVSDVNMVYRPSKGDVIQVGKKNFIRVA